MRYTTVDFDHASEAVQDVYSDYLRTTHSFEVPLWLETLGHSEQLARGYWSFVKAILVEGELPMVVKEMVMFLVSVTNGSPYCTASHAHSILARDKSLTFEDLVAMAENIDAVKLPEAMRVAIKFGVKLVSNPHEINQSDYAILEANGYSDSQVQEIIATASLSHMFNQFAVATQLPVEEGYREFPLLAAA